jgi:hypothetical protein
MALVRRADGRRGLLVVHDAPHAERLRGDDGVAADFFALP